MPTRVFSQQPDLVAALPQLLAHARRFFAAEVEVLASSPPVRAEPALAQVTLRFEGARYPGSGTFTLQARRPTATDQAAAELAERRGKAGGMAQLAARCAALWVVTAEEGVTGTAELQLSALLASIALGPVLPSDESTLYGVRGAMERAEKESLRRE
ncbi:MAG TPA: hypothetical protein VHP33_32720 [Polyangiaceae bacterium]|nr:hypothetical protein [Polyangiaceae bacterium]